MVSRVMRGMVAMDEVLDNSEKWFPILREIESGESCWVVGGKENKGGNKQGRYSSPLSWSHVSLVHM